ncbi:hypothetical protein RND71_007447 [Anisodus tanguticus]|uniref:Uncharacterized protein n=1 Tax=Anisodus tanguticus TaxID=243964 RepID=A0AAE1SME4_9SOLA|nr:hypothetical protein RND71_007447 [Anisodus tanguticus]
MDQIRNVDEEFYGDNSAIRPFQSLTFLKFEKMMAWERWQILSNGMFSSLEVLHISKCLQLTGDFPSELLSLKELEMIDCPKLMLLHGGMTTLHIQVGFLKHLPSFQKLHMYGMPNMQDFPLSRLPLSLIELLIGDCDTLKFELLGSDTTGSCNTSLETLTIENCESLPDIPLGMFPALQVLKISDCENLQTISFHCGVQPLNLRSLPIWNCEKLKLLPTQMNNVLQSLHFFELSYCQEIERFPKGGFPSNLRILFIIGCNKLMTSQNEWGVQTLTRHRYCRIQSSDVESFLTDSIFPPSLETLTLAHHPNLQTLNYKGLQNLTSLQNLTIWNCPRLY